MNMPTFDASKITLADAQSRIRRWLSRLRPEHLALFEAEMRRVETEARCTYQEHLDGRRKF
jgi:hypothetical protein